MSDAISNIIYSSRISDSNTSTQMDETEKSRTLDKNEQPIINLNMSDINEFPLIESTDLLLNSPEMNGDNGISRLSDKIIRKEQTLLTSTSSFFYDANNYEPENNKIDFCTNIMKTPIKNSSSDEVQRKEVPEKIQTVTNINDCINSQAMT